jgi:hypothetical protein
VSVDNLLKKAMSREGRKYIYVISLTVIPLLVFYGVISEEAAPLWVALVAAVVAPMTALTHLSPEEPVE